MKNVIVNKTQTNKNKSDKTKTKIINHQHQKLIIKKIINIIWGDIMIKHGNGWGISQKLQGNYKVYVKLFCGAKPKCIKDYIKPLQGENSDHCILHVSTN